MNQSKRAVLDLLLDEHGKLPKKDYKVHSVANAHKTTKEVQNWIENVEKIQKNRFAPSVVYTHKMPEIEDLMQAWDPEFEKILDENGLSEGDLDIPIEDLARFASALLDIPIYEQNKEKSVVEAVHLMFTLYSAFDQHFAKPAIEGEIKS